VVVVVMTVPCLVRVVARADRHLLLVRGQSPAEIKTEIAQRLTVSADLLVVVHQGDILPNDSRLSNLMRPASTEVHLIAFMLDDEQCRLAEAAKEFESALSTPPQQQPAPERNVVYEIPIHNAMEFLGRLLAPRHWSVSGCNVLGSVMCPHH
jgi:hypothetical protein